MVKVAKKGLSGPNKGIVVAGSIDKIGIVFWSDTCVYIRQEPEHACPINRSIGYIKKLKDMVLVISLLTDDDDLSRSVSQTIPNGCIKRIEYLYARKEKN